MYLLIPLGAGPAHAPALALYCVSSDQRWPPFLCLVPFHSCLTIGLSLSHFPKRTQNLSLFLCSSCPSPPVVLSLLLPSCFHPLTPCSVYSGGLGLLTT